MDPEPTAVLLSGKATIIFRRRLVPTVRRVLSAGLAVGALPVVDRLVGPLLARLSLPPVAGLTLDVALGSALVAAASVWLARWAGLPVRVRSPSDEDLWLVALGIGGALLGALVGAGLAWLFGTTPAPTSAGTAAEAGPLAAVAVLVLGLFVVAPVEELVFRGLVQGAAGEYSEPAGIVAGAVLFAAYHANTLSGSPTRVLAALAGLLVTGLALGVVRSRSGNLVVPALAHGLYNAAVLLPTVLVGLTGG